MTKIAIRVCSHLVFRSDTKAIYFADSAMIVHVVPESAEVSSCGLRNISRVAEQCIWRRAGDGRTIIYTYIDCEHSTRLCGARSGSPQQHWIQGGSGVYNLIHT